jgi:hypothetical protein
MAVVTHAVLTAADNPDRARIVIWLRLGLLPAIKASTVTMVIPTSPLT